MENEGGRIEVKISELVLKFGSQYQVRDDVQWPRVMPHQDSDGLGGIDQHDPRSKSQSVAEPQMGGFLTYTFGQVRGPGCLLLYKCPPVHGLLVKGWRQPDPVYPLLR